MGMNHFYAGRRVLITGGLGFIASNLALQLEELGASVTVVDSCVPGCGSNFHNLQSAGKNIQVATLDIADPAVETLLADVTVVFNLAGEVSHTHSMLFPERDLEINSFAHLRFLNTCARVHPGLRIVYAGTRQVYGVPQSLPVDEGHPVSPVDFNGVHKAAASQYHLMLSRLGKLDAMVLRLTNIYGPRMAIGLNCQGFLPVFIGKALQRKSIEVFGDGSQLRDPVYVDDACDAFLRAGMAQNPRQRTVNVGSSQAISLGEIAAEISQQTGLLGPTLRPFPPDRKPIDIGSYYTCPSAAQEVLGWQASTGFREGVRRTLAYFTQHQEYYLGPEHECPLGHNPRAQRT